MDYIDELRRMQRMFDEMNVASKLEMDRATKLADSTRSLLTAFDQVDMVSRQLREAAAQLTTPWNRMLESLEEQVKRDHLSLQATATKLASLPSYEDWFQAFAKSTEELISAYDVARNLGIDKFAEDLRRNTDWFRYINAAASPVLSMLAEGILGSTISGKLNPALVEGFGADLLNQIARAEEADSEEEIATQLQAFLAWLIQQAKRLPGTNLSAEAILTIFLTIVSLLYAQHSGNKSQEELKEQIEQEVGDSEERLLRSVQDAEARIVKELRGRRAQDSDRNEYVVVKPAQLRQGPGTEFESLRILPPNVLVEEIGKEGGWLHVEFFDYVEGKAEQGWIAKELVKAAIPTWKKPPQIQLRLDGVSLSDEILADRDEKR